MDYSKIATEKINPGTTQIDTLTTDQILSLISKEDKSVAQAVYRQKREIAQAAQILVHALHQGKKIFLVGAGTSGRLGVMEAAECPPTFHSDPKQIQAIMAGGAQAVFKAQEGAEDNGPEGRRLIAKLCKKEDVVIGIAASGVTPFVLEALREAVKLNTATVLITCNQNWKKGAPGFKPKVAIEIKTGPEVLTGSTRMKAGTATKMVLNMITTTAMIRTGKAYGNLMVDLQIKSRKLNERAIRILKTLTGASREKAITTLHSSHGKVKVAALMLLKKIDEKQALNLLKKHQGFLRKALH